jgi:hypothetical protein
MSQKETKNKQIDSDLQGIKDRNESYLSTIYAIHGFIHEVKRSMGHSSQDFHSSVGRRMTYASEDSKRNDCTPDLVIQIDQNEGVVGEAKLLICKNEEERWEKYIRQAKKYDNELIGWWTPDETIERSSIVLITEISYSSAIRNFFKDKIDSGKVNFVHPFVITEFCRQQRSRETLFLRTIYENLPTALSKEFNEGKDLSLEKLVFENKEKKFYDAEPSDIEYIMDILWQNIFNQESLNTQNGMSSYDSKEKVWRISLNINELTKNVQKLYGSVGGSNREVEYPRKTWIKKALDSFVKIGLALHGPTDNEYIILFKRFSRPMEKFVYLSHKKQKKTQITESQLTLFDL